MATRSVYFPDAEPAISDGVLLVEGEEHRHLTVARAQAGEPVEVFDGAGTVWPGVVIRTTRAGTAIRVGPARRVPASGTAIVLAQAVIRNAAFDWILEKAVELGVARVVPFRAERSNETGRGRERRWERILVAATKQSKQYRVPDLEPLRSFEEVLRIEAASKVVFSEHGGGKLKAALQGAPVLCLVGPEGGWTPPELELIEHAGFRSVHFGQRVLRAETAALVGVGLVAYEMGVL